MPTSFAGEQTLRRVECLQGAFTEALNDAEKCVQMEPSFARGFGRKGAALYVP